MQVLDQKQQITALLILIPATESAVSVVDADTASTN